MAKNSRKQRQTLISMVYDLFRPEPMNRPAPATLYTRIKQHEEKQVSTEGIAIPPVTIADTLPTIPQLYELFDRYNQLFFKGKLPRVTIQYSTRMMNAGSYVPSQKIIRIGRKYHELFPGDVDDTLRHEMIHILNPNHDAAFKREAKRIGASLKGQSHPDLVRPPKYVYSCPKCGLEYARHRQLRMASCGKCSPQGHFDKRFKLSLKSSRAKSSK